MDVIEVSTVEPKKNGLKNPWVVGLVLVGVGYVAGVATTETPAPASPPVADLQAVTNRIAAVEKTVSTVQGNLANLYGRVGKYDGAELHLTEKGFTRIDTNGGTFFVSVVKAEPYLTGYKIVLNIGNPSMASFRGMKMTFLYGDSDKPLEWQTKEISTVATIAAGAWTQVDATLAPATADNLKYVNLSMETDTLSLRRTAGIN